MGGNSSKHQDSFDAHKRKTPNGAAAGIVAASEEPSVKHVDTNGDSQAVQEAMLSTDTNGLSNSLRYIDAESAGDHDAQKNERSHSIPVELQQSPAGLAMSPASPVPALPEPVSETTRARRRMVVPIRGKVLDEMDVPDDQKEPSIASPPPTPKPRKKNAPSTPGLPTTDDPVSEGAPGRVTKVSSIILEHRTKEMEKLAKAYGDEDNGWGLKVSTKSISQQPVPVAFSLCILPVLNRKAPNDVANFFKLLTVEATENGYKQEEYGEEFHGFPPIDVRVVFPQPDSWPANFELSCLWLPKDHFKLLTMDLQRQYVDQEYSVVKTVEWLEKMAVKTLDILDRRRLFYVAPDIPADRLAIPASHLIVIPEPRTMVPLFRDHAVKVDACQSVGLDVGRAFVCEMCSGHRPAMAAVIFNECGHYFCRACVGEDLSIKIKEAVMEFTCPFKHCKTAVEEALLRTLVDRDVFRRYCDLTANESYVWCPRKECGMPMDMEPGMPRKVQCRTCDHPFWSACKNAPHPDTPCFTDEPEKEILGDWAVADETKKEEVGAEYGEKLCGTCLANIPSDTGHCSCAARPDDVSVGSGPQ